jgi:hypothetical protein
MVLGRSVLGANAQNVTFLQLGKIKQSKDGGVVMVQKKESGKEWSVRMPLPALLQRDRELELAQCHPN